MNELRQEFEDMINFIKDGMNKGKIKMSQELSDFDFAVFFAIQKIGERKGKGKDYITDTTEIYQEIMKFAPELIEKESL